MSYSQHAMFWFWLMVLILLALAVFVIALTAFGEMGAAQIG